MKRKIRIGIDVDNVIVDFSEQFVVEFNRLTGKNICRSDITQWDIEKQFSEMYDDINEELVRDILHSPNMVIGMPYKEQAKEVLLEMHNNENVDIVIITALHKELAQYRIEWFKKEFGDIEYELHFEESKSKIHLNNPIDYMIDDGLHNLDDLSKYLPKENCICIEEPYNNSDYITFKTLKEAYNYILEKENNKK